MPDSYTALWTQDRCRRLKKLGQVGATLEILFGGPHLSQPRFSRFGTKPGDYVYPVHVSTGVLYVLGRMRVKRLLTLRDYIAENPSMFADCEETEFPNGTPGNWLARHPEMTYLVWSCTDEVVIGEEGTPIRFDIAVPSEALEQLRFRSRRGERGLRYVQDGKLKRVNGLDGGVYRLSPASGELFEDLVMAAKPA